MRRSAEPMLLTLYRAATHLGAPLVRRHLRARAGRGKEDPARLAERLGAASRPRPPGPLLWLHAASVGESLSALPLLAALRARWPAITLLVTTGTVTSARLMAERLPEGVLHQLAPVDLPMAQERFQRHWRPGLVLLVESELWPNLLLGCRARGVPLVLVNARLSERSLRRWRRAPASAARLLESFALCLAQSDADAARLRALGARDVRMPGNLKHAAPPLAADKGALATLARALAGRRVWLAASTHPGEEAAVAAVHRELAAGVTGLMTIIVPRHPERGDAIAEELRGTGLSLAQRSRGEPAGSAEVYLADTLGELGLFYRVAELAFVGGSLIRHGGQNPLEPARLGCPVLFGPHSWNFADITAGMLAAGAARRVADTGELAEAVRELLLDEPARRAMAERASTHAASESAVLERTIEALAPLLERVADAGA